MTFAQLTTLRIGGPAPAYQRIESPEEVIAAVAAADAAGKPVLVLGGGSNIVVGEAGFDGDVIHIATKGIQVVQEQTQRPEITYYADEDPTKEMSRQNWERSPNSAGQQETSADSTSQLPQPPTVRVQVAAGQSWDEFVAHTLVQGWSGLEALSGIPGTVGATPVQNVGAYGQEVAAAIRQVQVWDRAHCIQQWIGAQDCDFAYRWSRFKGKKFGEGLRYVILLVEFELEVSPLSAPVRYAELARRLGVSPGDRAPATEVREAVLALRAGKGMVIDPQDPDTWSAGSFFTNPIVAYTVAEKLPENAPRWPMPPAADGTAMVKLSAAWLIENSGFHKGYGAPGPATVSTKHTLAITNRGTATAADVLALASHIRDGVHSHFGVTLTPEPIMINCQI